MKVETIKKKGLNIYLIDVDCMEDKSLLKKYGIGFIPAYVIFKNGKFKTKVSDFSRMKKMVEK